MLGSGFSHASRGRTFARLARVIASLLCLCAAMSNVFANMTVYAKTVSDAGSVPAPFYTALEKALKKRKTRLDTICPANSTARRFLEDYGAMFLAAKKVMPPPVCLFTSDDEVSQFQTKAGFASEAIGDVVIELQREAMKAYLKARDKALDEGLDITPRDGPEAARRTYSGSLALWNTRVLPALEFWTSQGRLTPEQADHLRQLPLNEQVAAVLELEKTGVFFSKDFSKSILYSIAAPGASQHLSMLALDVNEFRDERVRRILAEHGWFQTVLSDLPHFTFLGLKEKDLPKKGLRSVEVSCQTFWIPNVEGVNFYANSRELKEN
jgi:hypothetical protein